MSSFTQHPAFKQLKALLGRASFERDALWIWDVGNCVEQLFPRGESNYGSSQIDVLAQALADSKPSIRIHANKLVSARAVATKYMRPQVAKLCKLAIRQGHPHAA
jgi:hypothetical protein